MPKNVVMNQVSRPFQIALVVVVAFLGVWMVALRPSSSSSTGTTTSPAPAASTKTSGNAILSAPAKARAAVAAANAVSGAAATASPGTGTSPAAPPTPATTGSTAVPATTAPAAGAGAGAGTQSKAGTKAQAAPAAGQAIPTRSAQQRLGVIGRAIEARKVVAILFYNPRGADDREVKGELAAVPSSRGKVVSLAVPLTELSNYPVVTSQVPVTMSPTLVIVNPRRQASTIVGFADGFEISQRIADAVSVRRS